MRWSEKLLSFNLPSYMFLMKLLLTKDAKRHGLMEKEFEL